MPINYKKYCKDWKVRSKFIRFYRAKNKCEVCGVENYSIGYWVDNEFITIEKSIETMEESGIDLYENIPIEKKPVKVILTVAHLDHDINNNSFYNLKAMCQRCHLRYDAKHHAETRRNKKYQKQTTLFQQINSQ